MKKVSLAIPLVCIFCSTFVWLLSGQVDPGLWRTTLVALSLVLGVASLVSGLNYLSSMIALRTKEFRLALAAADLYRVQALTDYLKIFLMMSSDQLEAAGRFRPTMYIASGHGVPPVYILRLDGGVEVIMTFITEFHDRDQGLYLPEIRQWSEGSYARTCAQALTEFFVKNGFAAPPAGNHSARWYSSQHREDAYFSAGYIRQEV